MIVELGFKPIFAAIAWISAFCIIKSYIRNLITFGKIVCDSFSSPVPIFGHLLYHLNEGYDTMFKRVKENIISQGHEISCVWFCHKPVIRVVGPNAAEVLMRSSKHIEKAFFYKFLQDWLGTGLLTSSHGKWSKRRKLLTPTFHFSILQDFLPVMNEQSQVLINILDVHATEGKQFDIFVPITLCSLDIICETAMGRKVDAQTNSNSDYVTAIHNISESIRHRVLTPWLWWRPLFSISSTGRKHDKALKVLHTFTRNVITDRLKKFSVEKSIQKKRLAFLDLLIMASEGGKVLGFSDIQEEVDTFMFEGHDTTAAAMSWAVFLIASHPDVQKRIQEELDEVVGVDHERNITINSDDLKKLQYLELAIKESLRCMPSVPVIGRVTSEACVMDGHKVPAGTACAIYPQLIHNFPKYWPEPDRFDPNRFLAENIAGKHPYSYVPFSAGPRNCIGQKFAMMEEKVVLAHLFLNFSVEACDKKEDLMIQGDLILRPENGIRVRLKKRTKIKH